MLQLSTPIMKFRMAQSTSPNYMQRFSIVRMMSVWGTFMSAHRAFVWFKNLFTIKSDKNFSTCQYFRIVNTFFHIKGIIGTMFFIMFTGFFILFFPPFWIGSSFVSLPFHHVFVVFQSVFNTPFFLYFIDFFFMLMIIIFVHKLILPHFKGNINQGGALFSPSFS